MLEKHPKDVSFKEIKEFCDRRIPEASWLDYKQKFSPGEKENKQVAKIVSALANAHGGWVLFGIKESKDSEGRGLPGEILGIDKVDNPGERLKQICLNAIYPPILPEIGVADVETDPSKVLVVARVHESDSAPHRCEGKVYVRSDDISYLADNGKEASVEELEFLLNKRSKAGALKMRLLDRANERHKIDAGAAQLILSCMPTFPGKPLVEYKGLDETTQNMLSEVLFRGADLVHTAHESIYGTFHRVCPFQQNSLTHFESNVFGLCYYRTIILSDRAIAHEKVMRGDIAGFLFYSFLLATDKFLSKCDYHGLLDISMSFACDRPIRLYANATMARDPVRDKFFSVEQRILRHQLTHDDTFIGMFRNFLWAAGFGTSIMELNYPVSQLIRFKENPTQPVLL